MENVLLADRLMINGSSPLSPEEISLPIGAMPVAADETVGFNV